MIEFSLVNLLAYFAGSILCYLLVALPLVGIVDNTSLTDVKQRFKESNIFVMVFRIAMMIALVAIITFFITGMFLMIAIIDITSFFFISKLVINQFYEKKMSWLTRAYAIVFYGREEL